ncbi:MAG: hypothetical protein V3U87_15840 [Methylococcaceae bacterium]
MKTKTEQKLCRVCGHPKDQHGSHIGPDWTGEKIKHVCCRFIVKRSEIDMHEFGISSIGHNCSCDGFKPNTSLKRAIKKYQKFLRGLERTSANIYKRREIEKVIRRFRKSIKENPENLLSWQVSG